MDHFSPPHSKDVEETEEVRVKLPEGCGSARREGETDRSIMTTVLVALMAYPVRKRVVAPSSEGVHGAQDRMADGVVKYKLPSIR